mgnify:CR=1 FL=1
MGIPGEYGSTCETAGYFFLYHVLSRWEKFQETLSKSLFFFLSFFLSSLFLLNSKFDLFIFFTNIVKKPTGEDIEREFPFTQYFSNAPQPLFPPNSSFDEAMEVANGCFNGHLKYIFTQLEEIRAFELLKSGSDRANYLLTKEAKIIAMTCTHAALKRREVFCFF